MAEPENRNEAELRMSSADEALFSRDFEGQLIRFRKADNKDFETFITVKVDGQDVTIRKATFKRDSQGNVINDSEGEPELRFNTIYDAAYELYGERLRNEAIIPTLCHVDHMHPVGVCRMCTVYAEQYKRGNPVPTPGMVPSCVQAVEVGMEIHTRKSTVPGKEHAAKLVNSSLRVLVDLLAADHLPAGEAGPESEFSRLVAKIRREQDTAAGAPPPPRFLTSKPVRVRDSSSRVIEVDHTACILCDRCSRACNEIKQNFVIGRSGKGYGSHIGFDLNDEMGLSSCVECGECMLSCPTTALTFKNPVESEWHATELARGEGRKKVAFEEARQIELLRPISDVWLKWNLNSILRWDVKAGQILCHIGEYGSTAFVIESGKFDVLVPRRGTPTAQPAARQGWLSKLFHPAPAAPDVADMITVDTLEQKDHIVGEMSCLSSWPRTATVRAKENGVVYIIRRNVLYYLQRNPEARRILNDVYLERAIESHLKKVELFKTLSQADRDACIRILVESARETDSTGNTADDAGRNRTALVRLDPGQVVFREGESPDALYVVRLGYVKLTQKHEGQERVLNYIGPDAVFGESAFMLELDRFRDREEVSINRLGRRTATATALDDVELVRIPASIFGRLVKEVPAFEKSCLEITKQFLKNNRSDLQQVGRTSLESFSEQGLYNGQKLLVIDLENCTRCDECTRACSDTHDGILRLIRDGQRFDKFLVASSCRSCTDPYCLVGCPVDAIHREGFYTQINIESHCIGCGVCANNCPYGNINMSPVGENSSERNSGADVVRRKAYTCDLCAKIVGPEETVSCVYACPHHAIARVDGSTLLTTVEALRQP